MTVPATARRAGPYNGNGSTTSFSFSFKTFAAGDLQVTKTGTTGLESVLVLDSDYSVTLNPDQDTSPGGTITYPITGTALATGEKLTIVGDLEYEQTTDLLGGGAFNARVIEDTFDRTVIQIQQLEERADRALTLPVSFSGSSELPTPVGNAAIGWNESGTGFQNLDVTNLVTIAAFGTTQADLFTGNGLQTAFTLTANPGALANLDVSISGVTQIPSVDYTWSSGTTLTMTSPVPNGAKLLVRYGQVLPSGGGTTAPSSADLISYDPLLTYPANSVGAELRTAQSQVEHLWRAIRNNQRDIYLIVTGDSTGNEATEWVYLMAQWLATQCPTHTIKYRLFNDGTTSWDAYTTLQTGTGPALPFTGTPFTIHIDNGSVSGTNTFYTQGARESAFWTGIDYDLAIVNYGHNLGTAMTEAIALPEWAVALSHVRMMAPRAGLLVTLQNPRSSSSSNINTNGSAQSARMVAAWRKAVELIGAGVIDVYTAFRTHPDYASLMADETHPSALGSQVWVNEVKRVMAEPVRMTGDAPMAYNPLAEQRPNFAPNPRFSSWIGSTPDGWTFTNCTATKDTGVSEGGLYSLRITAGAGTSPAVTADVSSYLPALRGKTVTFCARVWRPAGLGLLAGRIEIASTDNVTSSASFVSYPRGTPSQGGWEWAQATLTIPRTHTQLTLRIYAGAADGSDNGESMYVDSVWFGPGWLPGQASLETAAAKFVPDFYAAGNVGRITGNTGTLTVVGTTITLVGSPSANSDVYINLPGLTPGQQYTFTFNADSCTGNTAGGIYVRNGFNGGFTTITTGTWTVGSPSTTTFTAPNGPVSLWVYGYTGATGWQISATSVRAVSPTFLNIPIGNLAFTGTAQRITGDFSNATWANRLAFQTSTVNGSTSVPVLPNGTGTASQIALFGNSDPTNASYAQLVQIGATETRLTAAIQGTGTYTPLTFYTGGSERFRFLTTGGITSEDRADAVGYKGTPLNEQSANYTLVIGDMGKSITHPISDNNPRTFTIPANGTVPFPVGTTITFINMINTVTIAITTDTMYLAGAGTTGSRTLAAYGMATAVKVTSTSWIISGNGLT